MTYKMRYFEYTKIFIPFSLICSLNITLHVSLPLSQTEALAGIGGILTFIYIQKTQKHVTMAEMFHLIYKQQQQQQ